MFQLIRQRMSWMDEKGLRQWNVTGYEEAYPLAYYEQAQQDGQTFGLFDSGTGELLCAAVILEIDSRWQGDKTPALYLHNFASRVGRPGMGKTFLECLETYAVSRGKDFLRLDSAEDNEALTRYYAALGFQPVGTCREGPYYCGILRLRAIKKSAV